MELERLEEMISRTKWLVPVLPGAELEVLLNASIDLSKRGLDTSCDPCQRFIRDGLTTSFIRVLTDDAVNGWKPEIHKCIFKNCERLIELCVLKLQDDVHSLLDLLAIAFNPQSRFHTYNSMKLSEASSTNNIRSENEVYAEPADSRVPKLWLVDLVNLFGRLGGFHILLDRFQNEENLSVMSIFALIRPIGFCHEYLRLPVIKRYVLPIIEVIPVFLEKLTDEELKKEAKNESKNDALSTIVKLSLNLISHLPGEEETTKSLEMFRLKMIHRLLQISSFNVKMNALNELNKVLSNLSYYSHGHNIVGNSEVHSAARMAQWIKENRVLQIVLRDSMHQPQYVEKLEKIIRFIIKEKALTLQDLDCLWAAQCGKHEAIVKNVHDLLAKLAWDFSPEQLDHLFSHFRSSWVNAARKQRERLLELIRRLAEEDKDGVMAHKVLHLLWSLAHSEHLPNELMDQALSAHTKILDCSCSQDRDTQKKNWLDQCVDELHSAKWVLPTLKQIGDICCLYQEAPNSYGVSQSRAGQSPIVYRHSVINQLQDQHSIVTRVSDSLTEYMHHVRAQVNGGAVIDPLTYCSDGRFNHIEQLEQRLLFLRFLLRDGRLWLCAKQACEIWQCLAVNAVFAEDREVCFKWFCSLMSNLESDLDPDVCQCFFLDNILQLDPSLLTESGIECFDVFFKAVNVKAGKLVAKRHVYLMEHDDPIGLDYLWRVVMSAPPDIAAKAIDLLKETYTSLGPRLRARQTDIHREMISSCMDRLRACFDNISVLDYSSEDGAVRRQQATTMFRVLRVLYEYIVQCEREFDEERVLVPLFRAFRGRNVAVMVRLANQARTTDLRIDAHTQQTVASLRRSVLQRVNFASHALRLEMFPASSGGAGAASCGEATESLDERLCLEELVGFQRELQLTAKLTSSPSATSSTGAITAVNAPSSPESSSDSSTPSPQQQAGPGSERGGFEAEAGLPGVIWARHEPYVHFLLQLAELGCSLDDVALRNAARSLLDNVPAAQHVIDRLLSVCEADSGSSGSEFSSLLFDSPPSHVLYYLQVLYSVVMPCGVTDPMSEARARVQCQLIRGGAGAALLDALIDRRLVDDADPSTRRLVYLHLLRLVKLVWASTAAVATASSTDGTAVRADDDHALCLSQSESTLLHVAQAVASRCSGDPNALLSLSASQKHVDMLLRLVWWACCVYVRSPHVPLYEFGRDLVTATHADVSLCREAFETLSLVLCQRVDLLEQLIRWPFFAGFVVDLLLVCGRRVLRQLACDQLFAVACRAGATTRLHLIRLLFGLLESQVPQRGETSRELFQLLCRLLEITCQSGVALPDLDLLLQTQIARLTQLKESVLAAACGADDHHYPGGVDQLLEGQLKLLAELVAFLPASGRRHVGSQLVAELISAFLFTHSMLQVQVERRGRLPDRLPSPVCRSTETRTAALHLLAALSTGCVENLRAVVDRLVEMYYGDCEDMVADWEYTPPVDTRPLGGFVGLKNAGATCYMNSVLQQLFMIDEVRMGVLGTRGVCVLAEEDFSGEERQESDGETSGVNVSGAAVDSGHERDYNIVILKWLQVIFGHLACSQLQFYVPRGLWTHFRLQGEPLNLREQHDAVEFFVSLVDAVDEAQKALGQPLVMSGQLGGTFSDQKICKQCPHRYAKEEAFTVLNVDIHNFTTLTESLDQYVKGDLLEGANAYHCDKCNRKVDTVKRTCIKKLPPTLCIQLKRFDYDWERDCAIKFNEYFEFPRELNMEPYTVRGLARIEGEPVDADWHDEGCDVRCGDGATGGDDAAAVNRYQLTGVVVHSGQASGGHYYSFVLHRDPADGRQRWYKFDDYDVTECRMHDDEEMRAQCFGGEYVGEMVDQMMKRVSSRRQKRWWNAYMLFYTRLDKLAKSAAVIAEREDSVPASGAGDLQAGVNAAMSRLSLLDNGLLAGANMPEPIRRSILRQNIRFLHTKNQFHPEFVQFIRQLSVRNATSFSNSPPGGVVAQQSYSDDVSLLCVLLACRFLFIVGFHLKRSLRGPAVEWLDALTPHLSRSAAARCWLLETIVFAQPGCQRLAEYLLECPSQEVRHVFARLLALVAHSSGAGEQMGVSVRVPQLMLTCDSSPYHHHQPLHQTGSWLSVSGVREAIVRGVLGLVRKDIADHGRHLPEYLSFFLHYASCGVRERCDLLELNVHAVLMSVAVEEGPGPAIKFQYAELGVLYQTVALLVRSCHVQSRAVSSHSDHQPIANPHCEPPHPLQPLSPQADHLLFAKSVYIKKVLEDGKCLEDTAALLRYCCWENAAFSTTVLNELLHQISYSYNFECRPYLDLLLHVLLLQDSWQRRRVVSALRGAVTTQDESERVPRESSASRGCGLFDTAVRFRSHHQRRAYQCIRFVVELLGRCALAQRLLSVDDELRRQYYDAVHWLRDELERRPFQTVPPSGGTPWWHNTSLVRNDTANVYYLERSPSAMACLERALELCPAEETASEPEAPTSVTSSAPVGPGSLLATVTAEIAAPVSSGHDCSLDSSSSSAPISSKPNEDVGGGGGDSVWSRVRNPSDAD